MGKNFQGGKKAKGMASRNGNEGTHDVRKKVGNEEEYAKVTAVLGNGRFRVLTENKVVHMAVLPGSMRGHKKRNNYVELNTFALINNRSSWQTYKEGCPVDIDHVYTSAQADSLQLSAIFDTTPTDLLFSNSSNVITEQAVDSSHNIECEFDFTSI
jgi:hypothetical protein